MLCFSKNLLGRPLVLGLGTALTVLAVAASLMAAPEPPSAAAAPCAEGVEFFEKNVRPLRVESCYACHSGKSKPLMGDLRVDGRSFLLKPGPRGASVVPGDPEK